MGVSWDEFWKMTPRILNAIQKGYQERMEYQDFLNWMAGNYTLSALSTAIDAAMNGKKAKAEYEDKPLLPVYIKEMSMTEEEREERDMKREIANMERWIAHDANRGLPQTNIL